MTISTPEVVHILDHLPLSQIIRQVAWIMLGFSGNCIIEKDNDKMNLDFRKYRKVHC